MPYDPCQVALVRVGIQPIDRLAWDAEMRQELPRPTRIFGNDAAAPSHDFDCAQRHVAEIANRRCHDVQDPRFRRHATSTASPI
jgi:hypothetical protein